MENANLIVPVPPNRLHDRITQELNELHAISAMIDSRLENINHTQITIPPIAPFKQPLNDFMNPPDEIEMDDLESDNELVETSFVYPFLDSDDGEVLNELDEYENAGNIYCNRIINSINEDNLAFTCMTGLKKTREYKRNFVAIVRDVYVFIGSFTYVTDFVVLEDIKEFIISDMSKVVMGRPFRAVTQLE
nr:retrotransposon Orf1 [Tanacetum cinerariifolium]